MARTTPEAMRKAIARLAMNNTQTSFTVDELRRLKGKMQKLLDLERYANGFSHANAATPRTTRTTRTRQRKVQRRLLGQQRKQSVKKAGRTMPMTAWFSDTLYMYMWMCNHGEKPERRCKKGTVWYARTKAWQSIQRMSMSTFKFSELPPEAQNNLIEAFIPIVGSNGCAIKLPDKAMLAESSRPDETNPAESNLGEGDSDEMWYTAESASSSDSRSGSSSESETLDFGMILR